MFTQLPQIEGENVESIPIKDLIIRSANKFKQMTLTLSRHTFLHYLCLCIILSLAALIRLLPMRWGFFLSEFDPYFQFRITSHLIENGFTSLFKWHDDMSWYPWGRDVITTSYPGLAFSSAIFYNFLEFIGIDVTVYKLCIIFPVVMGTATILVLYLLGKELWGKTVGLISALFLAFNSSHIFRTSLGFFDDETIGIFTTISSFFFYLRAIDPTRAPRSTLFYSLLSALSLSYLSFSWGAFRYPISLIALFSFTLVVIGRYSKKLLISYCATFGLTFLIMGQLPRIGYVFFKEWTAIAIFVIFIVIIMREISKRISNTNLKIGAVSSTILILIILGLVLWNSEIVAPLAGRFLSVINPSARSELPLLESVAEHRLSTWATFAHEFGAIALIGLFGFYFILQKLRDKDVFLILFGISSLYFASSLIRLTIILSLAISILAAITITELGRPSVDIIKGTIIFPKRKMHFMTKVGREYGIAILLLIIILIAPTMNGAVNAAYTPATIVTSSLPVVQQQPQDWLETLAWMKENLPESAVVMSWWDYGYWITTIADKRTLSDNGTINATQIATIARTFLSNETKAIPVLERYNITHIAILVTWYEEEGQIKSYGFGEDSKWYWMARIGNGSQFEGETVRFYSKLVMEGETGYNIYDRVISQGSEIVSNETIVDQRGLTELCILGSLMNYGISQIEEDTSEFFDLKFSSSNRFVFVYEVKYPKESLLSCSLSKSNITYGESIILSGELMDPELKGIPDAPIILQYSGDNGTSWNEIDRVITDSKGEYTVESIPETGDFLVRAMWKGISGEYLSTVSSAKSLTVMKTSGTLKLTLSSSAIKLGESLIVSCNFIPSTSGGNVLIEYSTDNNTWHSAVSGQLINGTFSTNWTPEYAIEYQIRAKWEGNYNYNAAISEIRILRVNEKNE